MLTCVHLHARLNVVPLPSPYVDHSIFRKLLLVVTSSARHLHIALDTVVLYDVLGGPSGSMDERVPGRSSDEVATAASNASLRQTPEENDTGSPRHKIGRRFAMNV